MIKNILLVCFSFVAISLFSQENDGCDERILPYWYGNINSRIEGESPALRDAFKEIQLSHQDITPENGFITLRLDISKSGQFCDIRSFQIDENYKATVFNNGELVENLERVARNLNGWKRDKAKKTYNLIRFKIKGGQIEEIF